MFSTASKRNKKGIAGNNPASFFTVVVAAMVMLYSCSSDEEAEKGKLIASVYDKQLHENEIIDAIPDGLSEQDSLQFVKDYVDTWVKENILLSEAEKELDDAKMDINNRIESYRRSLMIYEYEQKYLREQLDTVISSEEMSKYYNENKKDFELKDYIIKCVYVKLEKGAGGKDQVLKWIKSEKKEDMLKLEEYCKSNAVSFYQDRDHWIFLNDILRDVPIESPNKVAFLKNNKLVNFEDEEFAYVLLILDYRLKEETSPMSLEKENIKARILQSRMNELIRDMRNKTVKKAYEDDEVKLYYEE